MPLRTGPWLMTMSAILATLLGAGSCATGQIVAPVAAHPECAGWSPIRLSSADVGVLSDGAVTQVLAHNRFGEQRCGWKP